MRAWMKRLTGKSQKPKQIHSVDAEQRLEERKKQLHEKALTADKAKLISDFADETLADAQDYVLKRLLECRSADELYKLQADYRAAVAFRQKIDFAIADGRDAMAKLERLEEM